MRITSKGEYAAKAVLYLALKDPEIVTTQEIADRHNIPPKYLEQILLMLKNAGVLRSRRGIKGGYQLNKLPQFITVGEVLRVVDGNFARGSCPEPKVETGGSQCPDVDFCGLKMVWNEVQEAVEGILDHTTFDDVRQRTLGAASGHRKTYARFQV